MKYSFLLVALVASLGLTACGNKPASSAAASKPAAAKPAVEKSTLTGAAADAAYADAVKVCESDTVAFDAKPKCLKAAKDKFSK